MAVTSTRASSKPLIEKRSIDYIPETERHGRLLSQFTLWMGANLQITAIVTGALAVVLGGDVFWSLIGLLIGQLLGGGVMALHAAQGPKLGLPQMISSRVQFGVYGAAIPIVLVCLMYLGFTATGTVLSGQALGQLFGVSDSVGILIFASVIVLVTVLGYRVIHFIGRVASIIGVIAFVYLFARLMSQTDVGALLQIRHFSWSSFLLAVSLAASWQIAFGPYVADYSRYLPSKTSSVKTFFAAGAGSVIGAQVAMILGVFAAASANGQFAGHEVAYIVGLGGTGATAALLYFSIAFGKVTISTLNSYGSFMCIATIISGFRGHLNVTRLQRLVFVLVIVGAATLIALLGQHSFLGAFKSFILFLLAFFTPWSQRSTWWTTTASPASAMTCRHWPTRTVATVVGTPSASASMSSAYWFNCHLSPPSSIPVRWWQPWAVWIFPGSSVWWFRRRCITSSPRSGTALYPIN